MKRIGMVSIAALAVGSVWACQKDDSGIAAKLDEINQKLASIEQKMNQAPGAARQAPRPRPARPDASQVYAVPIDGAPFKGVANAKVTMVEAFEFA